MNVAQLRSVLETIADDADVTFHLPLRDGHGYVPQVTKWSLVEHDEGARTSLNLQLSCEPVNPIRVKRPEAAA